MKFLYTLFIFLFITEYSFSQTVHTVYLMNDTTLSMLLATNKKPDYRKSDSKRKLGVDKPSMFKVGNVNPFVYNVTIDGTQDYITYPKSKDSILPIVFSPFSIPDLSKNIIGNESSPSSDIEPLQEEYDKLLELITKLNELEAAKSKIIMSAELNDGFQSRKDAVHAILTSSPFSLATTEVNKPASIYMSMWKIYTNYTNQLEIVYSTAYNLKAMTQATADSNTETKGKDKKKDDKPDPQAKEKETRSYLKITRIRIMMHASWTNPRKFST